MSSKRRFTREFKLTAVRRMQVGEPVARLARELEVGPGELYRWYHEQEKLGAGAFLGSGHKRAEADRVADHYGTCDLGPHYLTDRRRRLANELRGFV